MAWLLGECEPGAGETAVDQIGGESDVARAPAEGAFEVFVVGERRIGQRAFHCAERDDTKIGRQNEDDPAEVARQGLDVLLAGKNKVVAASAKTKAQELANEALPDTAKAAAHRNMTEPGSAGKDESG
ncbi:hypothetical protein ACH3VS_36310 [Streptomyces sp. WSLK1-3]|uniref:hypothetical protein n=1 Tax=Streptomyces sp. WSLK1-3 TaxID=3375475 RepID=UPI0037936FFF